MEDEEELNASGFRISDDDGHDDEPLEDLEGNINDFRFDEEVDDDPDKDH